MKSDVLDRHNVIETDPDGIREERRFGLTVRRTVNR